MSPRQRPPPRQAAGTVESAKRPTQDALQSGYPAPPATSSHFPDFLGFTLAPPPLFGYFPVRIKVMKRQVPSAVFAVLLLAGCGAPPPPHGRPDLFDFLADGQTRKRQVLDHLGQPSGTFESGRVLTYRVGYEPANHGYHIVGRESGASGWPTWVNAKYSLVVVFDGADRLRRHTLLEVN